MGPDSKKDAQRVLQAAHEWLIRMEDPYATDEDRAKFKTWLKADPLHGDMYDRAVTVSTAIKRLRMNDIDADLHYQRPISAAKSANNRFATLYSNIRVRLTLGGAVAAAAAAAILFPALKPEPAASPVETPVLATIESATGETRTLTLTDGTEVTLGARTKITTAFYSDKRIVELGTGAAFFDVASDAARPFSVKTANLIATALGTKFDVRNSAGVFRVAVADGNVEVKYPFTYNGNATTMVSSKTVNAGQEVSATKEDGLQSVSAIDINRIAAWRTDRLIYEGASASEFVADLNRYSHVPIRIAPSATDMMQSRIRGVFHGQEVEKLLFSLTELYPIEIDQSDPKEIVLRPRDDG